MDNCAWTKCVVNLGRVLNLAPIETSVASMDPRNIFASTRARIHRRK